MHGPSEGPKSWLGCPLAVPQIGGLSGKASVIAYGQARESTQRLWIRSQTPQRWNNFCIAFYPGVDGPGQEQGALSSEPPEVLPEHRGDPGVRIEFGNPKHVVNFPWKILPNSGLHGAGDVKARWEASEKHIRAITSLTRQKLLFSTWNGEGPWRIPRALGWVRIKLE